MHVLSVESWQTPVAPDSTHRSPVAQSRDSWQALWHLVNAQMSGELQSLLIEQVLASPTPEELLQLEPAAAKADARASHPPIARARRNRIVKRTSSLPSRVRRPVLSRSTDGKPWARRHLTGSDRRGTRIPRTSIRLERVVRAMPSSRAAWATTPPDCASA